MRVREKKRSRNSILRLVLVGVSVLFQAGWILLLVLALNRYSVYISLATSILSLLMVLRLYSKYTTSALKMPWIMLILAFPVMGLSLYLLIEIFGDLGRTGRQLEKRKESIRTALDIAGEPLAALEREDRDIANQFRYLHTHARAPAYANTDARYYPEAEQAFRQLKEDLKKAEKFIFMEYFILEDGHSFRQIVDILQERSQAGVEVRLMYDDIGSVGYVNLRYARELNKLGIRCRVFNPALPVLNLFMNHRDHRKITVIDGRVGFTGGYNLADEYFGVTRPLGHWKDTGLRLEGQGVQGLTAVFLELWGLQDSREEKLDAYLAPAPAVAAAGFVAPFGDAPHGNERVAENVYLNMVNAARESVYFITPYLIITDEMTAALGLAAKRGVDVRIITPGVPDKKTIYGVTRSYYAGLVRQGVRIFEYSPGFCHAKQCLCDGRIASIGTSNLDYRSLYLHFENNVLMYATPAVEEMARDFEALFPQCAEVTDRYRRGRTAVLRTWQCILRLFAPLM